jgi:hypothetical protein
MAALGANRSLAGRRFAREGSQRQQQRAAKS